MRSETPSVDLWMPWFIRDHRAQAATLNHVEHSALVFFRMLLWQRDGVLPDDDKLISRELRITPRQWAEMRPIILQDCTIANGTITHAWTVAELAKARKLIEQRKAAGRASAAARSMQREGNERSTSVATEVQRESNETATARQPRAGAGNGVGIYNPSQEKEYDREERARELRVIGGDKP